MSGMMKAAVVRAFGKPLSIEDVPVPVPGPGEILVKVKVRTEITKAPLADVNAIFERMKSGKIDGRMVLDIG